MPTLTATGNFLGRPNRIAAIGGKVDYHFHNFDHTALPMAGLWRVKQFEYVPGELAPNPENELAELLMGPRLFVPPNVEVRPWVLIQKNRWHSIELVSKTMYLEDGLTAEAPEGEFWCCFSLRDYTGTVVEYQTGWQGAFM